MRQSASALPGWARQIWARPLIHDNGRETNAVKVDEEMKSSAVTARSPSHAFHPGGQTGANLGTR